MVPALLITESPALMSHLIVGCSTGFMEDTRGDWDALVDQAAATAAFAVELSALGEDELPGLLDWLEAAPRLPFRFVAVHGPAKGRLLSDAALAAQLARVPAWVSAVVLHPDALIELEPYRALGRGLAVENMDGRKAAGRTVAELAPVFEALPQARFCLDVAHAGAVDPGMDLAHELLDAFGARLSHVHLSSLDDDGRHVTLTHDDEERFAGVLARVPDVPWILEAPPA